MSGFLLTTLKGQYRTLVSIYSTNTAFKCWPHHLTWSVIITPWRWIVCLYSNLSWISLKIHFWKTEWKRQPDYISLAQVSLSTWFPLSSLDCFYSLVFLSFLDCQSLQALVWMELVDQVVALDMVHLQVVYQNVFFVHNMICFFNRRLWNSISWIWTGLCQRRLLWPNSGWSPRTDQPTCS